MSAPRSLAWGTYFTRLALYRDGVLFASLSELGNGEGDHPWLVSIYKNGNRKQSDEYVCQTGLMAEELAERLAAKREGGGLHVDIDGVGCLLLVLAAAIAVFVVVARLVG